MKNKINKLSFSTHEVLYRALIFSSNEAEKQPINEAYEIMKQTWYFINSDKAQVNDVEIEPFERPLIVNTVIGGKKPNFEYYFNSKITFSSTQNNIKIKEDDFINDMIDWIDLQIIKDEDINFLPKVRKRKYNEFKTYLQNKLDEITKPKVKADKQPLDDLNQFFWMLEGYFKNVSLQPTGDFEVNKSFSEYHNDKLIADVGHRAFLFVENKLLDNPSNTFLINSVKSKIKKIDFLLTKLIDDKKLNNGFVIQSNMMIKSLFDEFKNDFFEVINENSTNENPNIKTSSKELVKNEVKKELHNKIFKGNTFLVFETYYKEKSLHNGSRTDLRLLFELFKIDDFFIDTIELKHYIKWLNDNKYYNDFELKKIDLKTNPNINRSSDYKRIKTNLEITLK